MRVIRTEMYFDPGSIRSDLIGAPENPGIGVAWFGVGGDVLLAEPDVRDILSSTVHELNSMSRDDRVRVFLDVALQGRSVGDVNPFGPPFGPPLRNAASVDYVLNADIVYERSPPKAMKLGAMVRNSSVSVIGTYFGMSLADGNHPLMLLTVPAGIIIIGSAVGVSQGLQNGLNKAIDHAITSRLRK